MIQSGLGGIVVEAFTGQFSVVESAKVLSIFVNKIFVNKTVLYLTRENVRTARKREKNAKQSFAAHVLSLRPCGPSMNWGKSTVCLSESAGQQETAGILFCTGSQNINLFAAIQLDSIPFLIKEQLKSSFFPLNNKRVKKCIVK